MAELKKLGKYTIQSVLGQGAMGIVYKGFDPHIERTVALKTIRKDAFSTEEMEPLLARFKREAQAAGRLTHPGIVTVYEYGEDGDNAFIAMEYVRGRELKNFLDKKQRFPFKTIISIVSQLLDALTYSHAQGVVHRDIKPGNILLLGTGQIKIMDFGIARIESSTLTQFGDVIGTPSYMSPEQFSGQQVDKRSDLFSTGVILYHLLTGEKPFPGNSMTTIMHRVINTNAPLVSDLNVQVPSFLDAVMLKALAKKPDQRFQSAEEFKAALTNVSLPDKVTSPVDISDDATVMLSSSDPTVNLSVDEILSAPQQVDATGNHVELQEKFDKIVGLLESQGVATQKADNKLYEMGRKWVMAILVLTILTTFSYTVWIVYTEDLNYEELEQIVLDKVEDISLIFSDQPVGVVEISQSLKTKPTKEFAAISVQEERSGKASVPIENTGVAPSTVVAETNSPPQPTQTGSRQDLAPSKVLKDQER